MKKVLVTGASAGFGFETVKQLASNGHTVFATMRETSTRNVEKANALEQWGEENKGAVHVLELDVTNDASIAKAMQAVQAHGGLDVLINNAGLGNWGIDEGFTVEQAQKLFDINLFGVMRMNRAVLPHFREQGKGLIVYVSSGLGRIVLPFMGIYNASKFALEGYAETSSYELAPLGIESVIVQPGAYGTGFLGNTMQPASDVNGSYGDTSEMFASFGGAFEERAKSGQLPNPREVVNAIVQEVEFTGDERALRRPVGADIMGAVSMINRTCNQVQEQLLASFGLKQMS